MKILIVVHINHVRRMDNDPSKIVLIQMTMIMIDIKIVVIKIVLNFMNVHFDKKKIIIVVKMVKIMILMVM